MSAWTPDELSAIAAADELELAATLPGGTLSKPVTIWVVRSGDDLFVRSARGRAGGWYRRAESSHEGHIRAGGVEKDVHFVDTDEAGEEIDAAYRSKYARYDAQYVDPMVAPDARATTLKLVPV